MNWLTVAVAFLGPLIGIAVTHRLTSGRDRAQQRRADRERGRAERRTGYFGLFEAADLLPAAIADGHGEQALADLRRAKARAAFDAGDGVRSPLDAVVEAGERWVRVAAANARGSRATAEAAEAFRERFAAADRAMRADLTDDQGRLPRPSARGSLSSR